MEVVSGVWRAESGNEVVYAVDCGGAYALVDVGSEQELARKTRELEADGIDLSRVAAILITHSHQDHAGAVAAFHAQRPVRVIAHRLGVEHLRNCTAYTPLDRDVVDYTVDEGDVIEIGDANFRAHHLPGHTPDSVAWQMGDSLFIGDVIRSDGSIGWMDVHWGSCVSDYRSSLQRLLRMDFSSLYPGHGPCGLFRREVVQTAIGRLNTLAEADGRLLLDLGRPAPRRPSDTPSKIVRLSTGAVAEGA